MEPAARPRGPIEITAGAEPIELGSMLLTVVEPRRGHEVAYNRWYEEDHFYAGCMIGPYQFAGRRFVATADLKALREPDPSGITGSPERGSYAALYWVLAGYHEVWNRWAVRQVRALHAAGRMFEERDHVHTLLYRYHWQFPLAPATVPVAQALDHPYGGLVAVFVDRAPGVAQEELWGWYREGALRGIVPADGRSLVAAFTPLPLLIDAPGDVPRQEAEEGRTVLLFFSPEDPRQWWEPVIGGHREALEGTGMGRVVAALPFIPTIPGTDIFTDQLWAK